MNKKELTYLLSVLEDLDTTYIIKISKLKNTKGIITNKILKQYNTFRELKKSNDECIQDIKKRLDEFKCGGNCEKCRC